MVSNSTQFTGERELSVSMTLMGHGRSFYYTDDGERLENLLGPCICYSADGQQMISGSGDGTARLWDLREGEEIEALRIICEKEIFAVALSRDGRWAVTGGGLDHPGELKVLDMEKGTVKAFGDHIRLGEIGAIDISSDSKLLATASGDCTMQVWSLETGDPIGDSFQSFRAVGAVRFSRDSKKLAVYPWGVRHLEVWNIKSQELVASVGKDDGGSGTFAPVFWTMHDRTIIAAFDSEDHDQDPDVTSIYELDASALKTVGDPFQGHTRTITSLALSFDCVLLVSASHDDTVKLWAFQSRQLLASFSLHAPVRSIMLSPDATQVAYTLYGSAPHKIYISDIPYDILRIIWPGQDSSCINARRNQHIRDPLKSSATTHPALVHRIPLSVPGVTQPSHTVHRQRLSITSKLQKLLSTPRIMHSVETHDPLDFTATSSSHPSPAPATTLVHSNLDNNLRPAQALPSSTSTSSRSRPHRLSNWRPIRTRPRIINVPLAQGYERNAAAGAPRGHDGYVRDEEFDSRSSSPSPNSQPPSAGEHGSGLLCFCL